MGVNSLEWAGEIGPSAPVNLAEVAAPLSHRAALRLGSGESQGKGNEEGSRSDAPRPAKPVSDAKPDIWLGVPNVAEDRKLMLEDAVDPPRQVARRSRQGLPPSFE